MDERTPLVASESVISAVARYNPVNWTALAGRAVTSAHTAWSSVAQSATTNTLNGVWGTSASNVFAVGNAGAIIRYNGTAWSAMTSGVPSKTLTAVYGSDSEVLDFGRRTRTISTGLRHFLTARDGADFELPQRDLHAGCGFERGDLGRIAAAQPQCEHDRRHDEHEQRR